MPNHCGCNAGTCESLGAHCGPVPDGCGATLDCGACPAGKSCDPGAHACVATP